MLFFLTRNLEISGSLSQGKYFVRKMLWCYQEILNHWLQAQVRLTSSAGEKTEANITRTKDTVYEEIYEETLYFTTPVSVRIIHPVTVESWPLAAPPRVFTTL